MEGAGPFPRKISFFVLKMMFTCILIQFITGRKHGLSLEALEHVFYGSIAKSSSQKQCKSCPRTHGRTKGEGRMHNRRPMNTPQSPLVLCTTVVHISSSCE